MSSAAVVMVLKRPKKISALELLYAICIAPDNSGYSVKYCSYFPLKTYIVGTC